MAGKISMAIYTMSLYETYKGQQALNLCYEYDLNYIEQKNDRRNKFARNRPKQKQKCSSSVHQMLFKK